MLRHKRAETQTAVDVLSGGETAKLKASRRGFLGGTGLAAMGAAIGGTMPFSNDLGSLIPPATAQGARRACGARRRRRRVRNILKFPGKNEGLVVLGDRPLVAETPESLLDDDTTPIEKFYIRNNGQIPDEAKDPDDWKIVIDGEVEQQARDHARRAEERNTSRSRSAWCWNAAATAARRSRRRRAATSGPMAARAAPNGPACALADVLKDAGLKSEREIHRALFRRPASLGRRQQAEPSRAACASRRRWTRTR